MTTQKIIRLAHCTTFLTFSIGTIIFLVYYFSALWLMLLVGYAYMNVATVLNVIVIVLVHTRWKKVTSEKKSLFRAGLIMLANIPVAVLYIGMVLILLNTVRFTLTNCTDSTITDISLTGCEYKTVQKIKAGESEEIWFAINGDCHIDVSYKINGTAKSGIAFGYATNNMGTKTEYKIGVDK